LKGYAIMAELMVGLAQYFAFYNAERPHQSLGYKTPTSVYRSGIGGGALIVLRHRWPWQSLPFAAARISESSL
jgi:hypothetical protein